MLIDVIILTASFLLFALTWGWLFYCRFSRNQSILPPLKPARPVRWGAMETAVIFWMVVMIPHLSVLLLNGGKLPEKTEVHQQAEQSEGAREISARHPLARFLSENPSPEKIIFVFFVAAIWAPIFEEFIFRGVFQGWAEAQERGIFGRSRKNGWRAVLFVAFFFIMLHFRPAAEENFSDAELWTLFTGDLLGKIAVLGIALLMLRHFLHADWREMGLDLRYWKKDFAYGLLAFGAAAFPSYLLSAIMAPLCEYLGFTPDIFALIPITLAFGILYWRTRRILPGMVAHMLLNIVAVIVGIFS